jgi:hypothetical protein
MKLPYTGPAAELFDLEIDTLANDIIIAIAQNRYKGQHQYPLERHPQGGIILADKQTEAKQE